LFFVTQAIHTLFTVMLLKKKEDGALVEVINFEDLIDPSKAAIAVRDQSGQEEQDPEEFEKNALVFPSDELLPRCWLEADYQSKKSSLG
jgi:hypothetical protein